MTKLYEEVTGWIRHDCVKHGHHDDPDEFVTEYVNNEMTLDEVLQAASDAIDERVEELEFTVKHLVDMVEKVNDRYNKLTDELTIKVLRQLTAGKESE